VLPDGRAAYDGRASEAENWFERTGLAVPGEEPGTFRAADDPDGGPVADVRHLDVLPLPGGGYRIWYEARLPDESHARTADRAGTEAAAALNGDPDTAISPAPPTTAG
jgi:hypothetical protein